eukprot:14415703-Alexandrium_andersonii.AAC.1
MEPRFLRVNGRLHVSAHSHRSPPTPAPRPDASSPPHIFKFPREHASHIIPELDATYVRAALRMG